MRLIFSSLVLCLGGFLVASAEIVTYEDVFTDVGNANDFIDKVLKGVKERYGKQLDPLKLPDLQVPFQGG